MKNLTSLITATIFFSFVFGQTPLKLVKERVGNPDILKNWDVGDTKYVNHAEILRLEGENDYDFITNVIYTPKSLIMNLIDEKAKAEAFLPDEKARMINVYQSSAAGGQIALFFSRPSKRLAEPTNFSISVLDKSGNVTWSCSLKKEQPYYYKWEIWYYYKTINIPVASGNEFIIKVDDAAERKSYKFKVTMDEDAGQPQQDLSLGQTSF